MISYTTYPKVGISISTLYFHIFPNFCIELISLERSQDPREYLKYLSSSSPITLLRPQSSFSPNLGKKIYFTSFRILCSIDIRASGRENVHSREELHISEKQAQRDHWVCFSRIDTDGLHLAIAPSDFATIRRKTEHLLIQLLCTRRRVDSDQMRPYTGFQFRHSIATRMTETMTRGILHPRNRIIKQYHIFSCRARSM